jgi:hypothetical protein
MVEVELLHRSSECESAASCSPSSERRRAGRGEILPIVGGRGGERAAGEALARALEDGSSKADTPVGARRTAAVQRPGLAARRWRDELARQGHARLQSGTPDLEHCLGRRSFLPNGDFAVSTRIGSSEETVSPGRNDFFIFLLFPY